MLGYAYILTHPGIPCIFYDHYCDWGLKKKINELLEIRKRNDIRANSKCQILRAENDVYVACIDDKVMVKLGPGLVIPSNQFNMAIVGTEYCIWEKSS